MKRSLVLNLAHEVRRFKHELQMLPSSIRKKIRFAVLFGSHAEGKATPLSDIDIALYYEGTPNERFSVRSKGLFRLPDYFDIQIYQDLPLFVQKRVLRGKVLYAPDKRFVYEVAYDTIKQYDDFRKYLQDYLATRKFKVHHENRRNRN